MQHFPTISTASIIKNARRGALLLALGAAEPSAWGQSFGPVSSYSTGAGSAPSNVALQDVNGDGLVDIISAHSFSNSVGVLRGQAGGGFAAVVAYPVGAAANGVAVGDVDGDGRADVVVGSGTAVQVLLGQAGGGFAPASAYPAGATTATYSSVGVLLGQAGSTFASVIDYATGANNWPIDVAVGDVNGDGRPDIVTASVNNTSVSVLLGQAGGFAAASTYTTGPGSQPYGVALGDVNGDGRLDILTANIGTGNVGLLLGQANGFAPIGTYATGVGTQPRQVTVGDVNGDSRPDVVSTNGSTDNVSVLLNTGTYAPLATARPAAAAVAVFPNPAHDGCTVQLPAGLIPAQAELLNALGQVVRRPAVGGASFRVETGGLAPGLYTLHLLAGGAALVRRVVVE